MNKKTTEERVAMLSKRIEDSAQAIEYIRRKQIVIQTYEDELKRIEGANIVCRDQILTDQVLVRSAIQKVYREKIDTAKSAIHQKLLHHDIRSWS
jgi:hypothetical protein